jgi:glycosyltransferase involved in cell wall biosynthesis
MPTIAFIMQAFYGDRIGGAERQVQLLGGALRENGWRTVYICERPPDKPARENVQGMEVLALPIRKKRSAALNYLKLKRAMHESGADLFYQRIRHPYTGLGCLAARSLKKPFVWAAASTADLERQTDLRRTRSRFLSRDRLTLSWVRRLEDWGVLRADAIILQTQEQLALLEKNYRRRGVVIPNHVASCENRSSIPRRPPPEVLWLSNVKVFKRPELFIQLARECRDLEANFVMAGGCVSAPLLDMIRRAQSELPNFTYLGALAPEAAEERIAGATILVNTSLFEGFPNAFQQAWCHGVPTLSLSVDPDGVIVREALGCRSVTLDQLNTDLRRILGDEPCRHEIAGRAREFARLHYDLSRLLPRYLSIFEGLLRQ